MGIRGEKQPSLLVLVLIILEALMFMKSVIITLVSAGISASGAQAGLFGYTFNKITDSGAPVVSNPCNSETFTNQYGKYCSGMFNKSIRCLSEGGNPGVCDSSAVCDSLDRTAKNLCETHCLNTAPQKMGNQSIKISCAPTVKTNRGTRSFNPFEEGRLGATYEQGDNPAARWVETGTKASSPVNSDLPSIRDENEGSQDYEDSKANFYQTEHPKSFDEINTEKPWTGDISGYGAVYPSRRASGEHAGASKNWESHGSKRLSKMNVGGGIENLHQDQGQDESLSHQRKDNSWGDDAISTYPLDEVDQVPEGQGQRGWQNEPFKNLSSTETEGEWMMPEESEGYRNTSYQRVLESRFFTMPD